MVTSPMATTPTAQALTSHLAQVFAQYPIEVAHGEGVWLHARDGRKILDFYGGHAVAGLGYGHPRWLAALERQARQMAFQTNAVPLGIRERAAARLAGMPKTLGVDFSIGQRLISRDEFPFTHHDFRFLPSAQVASADINYSTCSEVA